MQLPKTSNHSVSIQGIPGSFHDEVAHREFKNPKITGRESFRSVFQDVLNGDSEFGIVALENVNAQVIASNYNLIDEYKKKGIRILGEVSLQIEQCLIGQPNATVEDIAEVTSHYMAINQSNRYLESHQWAIKEAVDTAQSVIDVRDSGRIDLAAVASRRAAELYQMKVLEAGIQNNVINRTRFIIFDKNSEQKEASLEECKRPVILTFKKDSLLAVCADLHNHGLTASLANTFNTDFEGQGINRSLLELKDVTDEKLKDIIDQLKDSGVIIDCEFFGSYSSDA